MVFEIPHGVLGLMKEYKQLIERALKRRNKVLNHSLFSHLKQHVQPITRNELKIRIFEEYEREIWFSGTVDCISTFVEERLGEEFVVLPELESKVFCLYEIEEFLSESEKPEFDEPNSKKEEVFIAKETES